MSKFGCHIYLDYPTCLKVIKRDRALKSMQNNNNNNNHHHHHHHNYDDDDCIWRILECLFREDK